MKQNYTWGWKRAWLSKCHETLTTWDAANISSTMSETYVNGCTTTWRKTPYASPKRSQNNFRKLESAHRQICGETLTNRNGEKLQRTATKSCDSHIERCGKRRQDRDGVAHHCCRGVGRSKNRSEYTLHEGEQLQRPASLKESLRRAAPALVLSLPRSTCGWFVDETPASRRWPSVDCSFIQS